MKYVYKLAFLLWLLPGLVAGQNLVPNWSFEDTVSCPSGYYTNMNDLEHWYSSGGSADLYHPCANLSFPERGVPLNMGGYQNPFHGIAYAGLFIYVDFLPGQREFMGVKLLQPLVVGTTYCVSAYVSRSDSIPYPIYPFDCAVNNLGFRFSTFKYDPLLGSYPPLDNFSHVKSDDIIYDSINWVKISGTFVADSAYEYLTIGNFYTNSQTSTNSGCTAIAYYYIDAVNVSTDTVNCASTTSLSATQPKPTFSLFPNPAQELAEIKAPSLSGSYSVSVFDSFGRLLLQKQHLSGEQTRLDLSGISSGLLLVRVTWQDQQFLYKLLKQ